MIIDHDELVQDLVTELPAWLPTQRWFAGKDRPITAVRPLSWTTITDGDPLLIHLVVEVDQDDRREPYQLLIGSRKAAIADVPSSAAIGLEAGLTCYEASGDADVTAVLLDLIASETKVGDLVFARERGVELTTGLRAHPITTEQSNTSLVFGREYILKLFRKVSPGENKDLRLHRALREVGCKHIADPLGSITGTLRMAGSWRPPASAT
jgi:maltokinase